MPDLNEALKALGGFIRNLDSETEPPSSFMDSEPWVLLSEDDATLFIRGEDSERFSESVQGIFDAVSGKEDIGRDSVERLVSNLVLKMARVKHEHSSEFEAQIRHELRALKDALQAVPTEWEFYIPVIGFAPSELPFQVGQIEFYQADASGTQQYWQRLSELNPVYKEKQPTEILAVDWPAQFGNKTIARIRVSANDLSAVRNRALKVVRRTLDCVNFFGDKNKGVALHVRGDVEQGQRVDVAIHLSQPAKPTGRATRIAPWRGMPIRQISRRPGFDRISELLGKATLSTLEDRILKAVQWTGRARVEPRIEESFLLYAVALETLLLRDSVCPSDLSYQLKLRTSHLVSRPDLTSRKRVFRQVGQLYGIRSKIVHTGKFDVTASELKLLDEYTRIALFIVLDREPFRSMVKEDEFEAWFEANLFGISQTIVGDSQEATTSAQS